MRGGWEALQPMFQSMFQPMFQPILGDDQPEDELTVGDWLMGAFIVSVCVGPAVWKWLS